MYSFPVDQESMRGRIWGDRTRERKGRLVKEWRNIISLSSRRGFVLHRLPSAPASFYPPPLFLKKPMLL